MDTDDSLVVYINVFFFFSCCQFSFVGCRAQISDEHKQQNKKEKKKLLEFRFDSKMHVKEEFIYFLNAFVVHATHHFRVFDIFFLFFFCAIM